jgi:hypothetical protein
MNRDDHTWQVQMDMTFKINEVPVVMGREIDTAILLEADFNRAGTLNRIRLRIPSGHEMYSLENCRLDCFEDDFSIYPCTDGYLDRHRQWGTRAELHLRGGIVQKLVFQVIEGRYAAANFVDRFRDRCGEVLGDPVQTGTFITRWRNGSSHVTAILRPDRVNADFLVELDADRSV